MQVKKQNTQMHKHTSQGLNHNETNYALNVQSKPTNPATNNQSITKQLTIQKESLYSK